MAETAECENGTTEGTGIETEKTERGRRGTETGTEAGPAVPCPAPA